MSNTIIDNKPKMKPSKHQLAIYDFMVDGSGNAVINAVAGSGKTTTILGALNVIPYGVETAFFAFNKEIAEEIKGRVSSVKRSYVDISTIHSYGFSVIKENRRGVKIEVDDSKYRKIFDAKLSWKSKLLMDDYAEYRMNVMRLVDLMRFYLTTDISSIMEVMKKYRIVTVSDEINDAIAILEEGSAMRDVIDYTDMIYYPVYYGMKFPKYKWVFIDECQDLSRCQRTIAMNAVDEDGGRFIAVGDPHQCIYGFAGADSDSFKELINMPNTVQLPLSVCYRCGSSIVKKAKEIVPHIEAKETADEGVVVNDFKIADLKYGDMVLCRQVKPLVDLCLSLISKGIMAKIKGRDIFGSIMRLIEKSGAKDKKSLSDYLSKYEEKELLRIAKNKALSNQEAMDTEEYSIVENKVQVIRRVMEVSATIEDIKKRFDDMFSDKDENAVSLSTIHRSKGLEADRVIIISPELMPSKYAKEAWEKAQEMNLMYVAYTRAKKFLAVDSDYTMGKDIAVKKESIKKDVEFVGSVGSKVSVDVHVFDIRDITTKFGKTNKYILRDMFGNTIVKIGSIKQKVSVGDKLHISAMVSGHNFFNGEKETSLGEIYELSKI